MTRIEITPNCSLSPQAARQFFALCCTMSFLIAGGLAAVGFWPVLPFAGLEMLLLGWALKASMARRHERQTITITEDIIAIDFSKPLDNSRFEFPRHWAQVRIRSGGSPLYPSRLSIESHGRSCVVGAFLNEQERQGLARRLKHLIGRVAETPPLPKTAGSTEQPAEY